MIKSHISINKEQAIYYVTIIASILYQFYDVTDNFIFRILSFLFMFLFYVLSFKYLYQRWNYTSYQFRETNIKALIIYLIIVLFLFGISIKVNFKDLITLLFNPLGFSAYYIAFISITVNRNTLNDLSALSTKINNFFPLLILSDVFISNSLVLVNDLCYFVLFEFLFVDKLSNRRKLYVASLFLIFILLSNHYDNRAAALRMAGVSILFGTFYAFKFLRYKLSKVFILLFGLMSFYFIVFHFETTYNYVVNLVGLSQINTIDTRSFLFVEFFEDFNGFDFIAGKGYLGTYFSQWFYDWEGELGDSSQRFSIEVGLLQILLKGGLLLLVPFLLIIFYAIKVGIINKNFETASFRLSLFLFVELFLMGIENKPSFSTHFLFIWLSIGIVFYYDRKTRLINPKLT